MMRRWLGLAGGFLLVALAVTPVRHTMEASMWRHMLVQFPLWMLAGAMLAWSLPPRVRAVLDGWNVNGIAGLVIAAVVLATLMVPRVLDLALIRSDVEVIKLAALVMVGAALALSWRRAGYLLQFFFLGNMLMMTVVVGWLYMNTPLRLCNAYLLDDQERLGLWLIWLASIIAVVWLVNGTRIVMQREQKMMAAERERQQTMAEPKAAESTVDVLDVRHA